MFMTAEQIELKAERMMDAADRRYMAGQLTEAEYQDLVDQLNDWLEHEYRTMREG
jgi:hypothetical protein